MNTLPVLRLGFRPFFLVAGISAVLLIGYWLVLWPDNISRVNYYPSLYWHSHEMLFGYTAAVIAGFLLTAVRNWSGIDTPTGVPLALVTIVWLLARILPFIPSVPGLLIAIVDVSFFPLLTVVLARALWLDKNKINRVFTLFFVLMMMANIMVHAEALGYASTAADGIRLMIDLIVLLILVITGRVLPFFTQAVIAGHTASRWGWVERSSILIMLLIVILNQMSVWDELKAFAYLVLAVIQVIRVAGWHHPKIWKIPVLWVLYTGYAWLIIGLLLSGLSIIDLFAGHLATHVLTVGVIGVFTLGMMSRVTLGHTGRPMKTPISTNIAFILINLAVIVRVFFPLLMVAQYELWINLSGSLWMAAFIIFCVVYIPYLLQARVDGAQG